MYVLPYTIKFGKMAWNGSVENLANLKIGDHDRISMT